MVVFPNAKINLGLRIVRKRADGFHELETIFYPIALHDVLEVIQDEEKTVDGTTQIRFSSTGHSSGDANMNLCTRAYQLLKTDRPQLPPVRMHLHKSIPVGAGLGGGSADASFTLRLLDKKFNLVLSKEELIDYAARLGSDCPFFIINQPCYGTGRGEILEPVYMDLARYSIVIINPGIHIETARAFEGIQPVIPTTSVRTVIGQPIATWKNELVNDFEPSIFRQYPEIKNIRDTLYAQGALYASMSGSGSTVFGIFEPAAIPEFRFPQHYYSKVLPGQLQ